MDDWYRRNPIDVGLDSEDKQLSYFDTFFAAASGNKCLCDLRHFVAVMPAETADGCCAKQACQDMLEYIRVCAGITDDLAIIRAEAGVPRLQEIEGKDDIDLLET